MAISVAFRADASVEIGSGHVMRCLTLADALARTGARCRFLCRDLPGQRTDLIAARGHRVDMLPPAEAPEHDPAAPRHAAWLPASQEADADHCANVLAGVPSDVVVVDHYALDARWERRLLAVAGRVVLDDLADRRHDCDILLDQNLGRRAEDYERLVPPRTRRLVGPRFALLAPDFAAAREESIARRSDPALRRLLVSLGGVDRDNVAGRILDALVAMDPLPVDQVDVVQGAASPLRADIAARAAAMPVPVTVHVGTPRMARLMTEADLAVGAGGGTSWERCCLGLPTLLLVLAENQAPAARALEAAGACANLGSPAALDIADRLRDNLHLMAVPERLRAMSRAAAVLVDGHGSRRVVGTLTGAGT